MSEPAAVFEAHRKRLFALAYRMLGQVGEAEDAVQDTYLRWHRAEHDAIRSAEAWLVTACTRLCIDRLRAAKAAREAYTGTWLPEPLIAEPSVEPAEALGHSLSMAFLVVLERLTPAERAAYLLREAFDYDYAEIARMLEKSEAACRQLVSRAQKHLKAARPRFDADAKAAEALAMKFAAATRSADPKAFAAILAQDAMIWSDGGGKALAALNVIRGADRCARFFAGLARKQPPGLRGVFCLVNGQPGFALFTASGKPYSTLALDIADGAIRNVFITRNPDKLARVPMLH